MKSSIISSRKQEMVVFFLLFLPCWRFWSLQTPLKLGVLQQERRINASLTQNREDLIFGFVIISGILAVIVVLLEYRTLRNFQINCNHCKRNRKQHPRASRVCPDLWKTAPCVRRALCSVGEVFTTPPNACSLCTLQFAGSRCYKMIVLRILVISARSKHRNQELIKKRASSAICYLSPPSEVSSRAGGDTEVGFSSSS